MQKNLERMINLAESAFNAKNDLEQLDVDETVIERLLRIHPATVTEKANADGPIAWLIMIPTTKELMSRFLAKEISEKELYWLTDVDGTYEAIYLCSAMVLEEFRRTGITKELTINKIKEIKDGHPISALFVWAFSEEGNLAAEAIAKATNLPLHKRSE
jgi:hypothetical protein